PSSRRPRAKSTRPRLSETDSRARRTGTSPGATRSSSGSGTGGMSAALATGRAYRQTGGPEPPTASAFGDQHPPRVRRITTERPAREQADRLGQQGVLEWPQRREHLLGPVDARKLDRPLEDQRPAV